MDTKQAYAPGTWQARLANRDQTLGVYLVGIGGAGLSAIATVLLEQGVRVAGSDRQASAPTQRLQELGARVAVGQRAENLTDLPPDMRPDDRERHRRHVLALGTGACTIRARAHVPALRIGKPKAVGV